MSSPEVFYLHIHGEQRGPYTVPQIDHLLNSGLIAEETLFWREGLEQWQPVTNLVIKRKPRNPWRKLVVTASILTPLLVLALFFGPVTLDAWREVNRNDFTAEGAYWRARETVRNKALPQRALVIFEESEEAEVSLQEKRGAIVLLQGEVTGPDGTRNVTWRVSLKYDPDLAEWSGLEAIEIQGE